uniref:Ovule protein n=1 Tax=Parascaris univalens TaxID=6257 RepID=A0A915A542_PARUN
FQFKRNCISGVTLAEPRKETKSTGIIQPATNDGFVLSVFYGKISSFGLTEPFLSNRLFISQHSLPLLMS